MAFSLVAIPDRSRAAKHLERSKPLKSWGCVFGQGTSNRVRVTGHELRKARAERMAKAKLQLSREKTPGAKVEGGTGFKSMWRHSGVYQRTVWGKASSCCESKGGSRKWSWVKPDSPETPQTGETVRNPKEGSTQRLRVTELGTAAQGRKFEGRCGTRQGVSDELVTALMGRAYFKLQGSTLYEPGRRDEIRQRLDEAYSE